jgi:glycosyltransferase involved in cell wall biosynthesis
MKINWFSPLPPAKTDIADYTLRVLPSLQNHAEVVLWTNQSSWDLKIQQYADVRRYQLEGMPWLDINQADWNIYHIGNNPDFHSDIWKISCQCSGLVVLHDLKLHNFFDGFYKELRRDKHGYITQMRRFYGIEGEKAANLFWSNALTAEFMAENYPLTLLALENAVGAIVHNRQAYNSLKQENRWLIGYTPLPYISNFQLPKKENVSQEFPYRLIIFGHIGPNRCLDVLLKALSTFPEKNCFRLGIYGQLGDRNSISQQIRDLSLDSIVTLRGFVEEVELEKALANAHLAINLRYPTMGEASGSQLRIWSHALPSIVTQVGWYAQLPENTVVFVRPEHEIEDIHKHLQSFLANPEQFIEMGRNGRRILEQQHAPEAYAQAIVDFAQKAQNFRHCSVASKLVERVGEQISLWSKSDLSDTTIKKAAEAIHFIIA